MAREINSSTYYKPLGGFSLFAGAGDVEQEVYTADVLPGPEAPGGRLNGWTEQTSARCTRFTARLSAVSEAEVEIVCGLDIQEGAIRGERPVLDPPPNFVRLVFRGLSQLYGEDTRSPLSHDRGFTTEWVGYVLESRVARGPLNGAGKPLWATQILRVVGLEWFLDRVPIADSVVLETPPNVAAFEPGDLMRIGRPLAFNDPPLLRKASGNGRGNRGIGRASLVTGVRELPAFWNPAIPEAAYEIAADAAPREWTGREIVEYLLAHYSPAAATAAHEGDTPRWDGLFPTPCWFELAEGGEILETVRPRFQPAGQTVFQALLAIASPRRGMGLVFDYDVFTARCLVSVVSASETDLDLPGGGSLPAAKSQIDLITELDPGVTQFELSEPCARHYSTIRVTGARATSTFTLSVASGTLKEGWTAADESAYAAADDDTRRTKPELAHVFTRWQVARDWDGTTNGAGGAPAIPLISESGGIASVAPSIPAAMTLLNRTRIRSGGATGPFEEFEPPRAYIRLADNTFTPADDIREAEDAATKVARYSLAAADNGLGVMLHSSKGLGHTLAAGRFTATSEVEPEINPQSLVVTLAAELDAYAEGVSAVDPPYGLPVQELRIDAGDSFRLDYIAPDTVTHCTRTGLVKAAGGILRDDRAALRDLAQLARQYYTREKRDLVYSLSRCQVLTPVGWLIRRTGRRPPGEELGEFGVAVNALVAEMTIDFERRTTTVRTAVGQFDVTALL